jgi:hypothetical protein
MNPRIMFTDKPPSAKLCRLLEREEKAAAALEELQIELDIELRRLSNERGLTMKLSPLAVRQELKMREQADGNR